jgi:hypothetical protein
MVLNIFLPRTKDVGFRDFPSFLPQIHVTSSFFLRTGILSIIDHRLPQMLTPLLRHPLADPICPIRPKLNELRHGSMSWGGLTICIRWDPHPSLRCKHWLLFLRKTL